MNAKQIGLVLVAIGAAVIIFGALAQRGPTAQAPARETRVLQGSLTPAGDYAYEEHAPYYDIVAAYPAKTPLSGGADAKARLAIEQAIADRIAEFKQNGDFENLTAEDIELQGIGGDRKYALTLEYKVSQGAGYHSYAYTVYEDTLGAHPNSYYMTLSFDKDGNEVTLTDIFEPGSNYLERISQIATAQVGTELARRLSADPGESFFREGVAPSAENFQNFYFEGDAIVFLFPPYQVAAYAAGAFQARIPLSELSDVRQ